MGLFCFCLVLKNGCGWRDLPSGFPFWNTGHYHFTKWGKNGTRENINPWLETRSYLDCYVTFGELSENANLNSSLVRRWPAYGAIHGPKPFLTPRPRKLFC
ncbi:transposase [Hymenobacter sp. IS2118]|uniref:transposase n=1 Tax=Hymenobacter sp. IS2118 TaxID=1505605 RepID=UPI0009DCBABD